MSHFQHDDLVRIDDGPHAGTLGVVCAIERFRDTGERVIVVRDRYGVRIDAADTKMTRLGGRADGDAARIDASDEVRLAAGWWPFTWPNIDPANDEDVQRVRKGTEPAPGVAGKWRLHTIAVDQNGDYTEIWLRWVRPVGGGE